MKKMHAPSFLHFQNNSARNSWPKSETLYGTTRTQLVNNKITRVYMTFHGNLVSASMINIHIDLMLPDAEGRL